jgi:hypothetical protein
VSDPVITIRTVPGEDARIAANPHVRHAVRVDGGRREVHHIYQTTPDRKLIYVCTFETLEHLVAAGFGKVASIAVAVLEDVS